MVTGIVTYLKVGIQDLQSKNRSKHQLNKNKLWLPRYWGEWFGVFLLWALSKLPYCCQVRLGRRLGLLTMRVMKSRRHVTQTNIAACFPELDTEQVQTLTRESYSALGQGILSAGLAWWASKRRMRRLLREVNGLEHMHQAFAQGRGVILLSAHFVADEVGGYFTKLVCEHELAVLHREQSSAVFEAVLQKKRGRYFNDTILRANIRKMIRTLKRNAGIFYLPDQTFEKEHSIFVPFMGVNALTLTATSRLAKMNNCVVLPVFCFQRADNKGFDLEFWPMLDNFPSGDDRADAIRINEIFAKAIRSHPAQYMWQHRRFKVRPDGEKDFY